MRKLKITDVNRELSHKKMWRGTGARRRFSGERKRQVGVGKFPPSWFESMRTREVLMDRSEVIGEEGWIPEIEQHCVKTVPWITTPAEDIEEMLAICNNHIDWDKQYGPPGKYIDIQYIQDVPEQYHPVVYRQLDQIQEKLGDIARGDPPNFSRILPRSCMHPHRDTPLRWCCLYLPLPHPGQTYAPTEHLWEDGRIYGKKTFEPGEWIIFNQDIWHAANNFTDQTRYTLQIVLDTSYEDFVEKFC